jgi:MATE family multidrug resistance protein
MTANLTALIFIQGLAAALDTLCPQAWTSPNPSMTSLYAMRTQCILIIMLIPQFFIFWNAERILLGLGQDPAVAEKAGQYLKMLFPGIPGCKLFGSVSLPG